MAGERIATEAPEKASAIQEALQKKLVGINATMASHKHGEKKSRFDDDVFDAVRTEDLANMVGAWKLGHVLDVKAMRKASGAEIPYVIGPRRDGDLAACYANPTKAREELGWQAELGIERMCADAWRWQSQNPTGYNTAAAAEAKE